MQALHNATEEEVGKQLGLQKWGLRRRVFKELQQATASAAAVPVTSLPLWMMHPACPAGPQPAADNVPIQQIPSSLHPGNEPVQAGAVSKTAPMEASSKQAEGQAAQGTSEKGVPATPPTGGQATETPLATAAQVDLTPVDTEKTPAAVGDGPAPDEPMPDAGGPDQQAAALTTGQQASTVHQQAADMQQASPQQQEPPPATPAATASAQADMAKEQGEAVAAATGAAAAGDGAGPSTAAKPTATPETGLITPAPPPDQVVVEDDVQQQHQEGGVGEEGGQQLPEARRLAQEEREIKKQMEAEGVCVGR